MITLRNVLRMVSGTQMSHNMITIIIIKSGADIQRLLNLQTEFSCSSHLLLGNKHPETIVA